MEGFILGPPPGLNQIRVHSVNSRLSMYDREKDDKDSIVTCDVVNATIFMRNRPWISLIMEIIEKIVGQQEFSYQCLVVKIPIGQMIFLYREVKLTEVQKELVTLSFEEDALLWKRQIFPHLRNQYDSNS